MLLLTLCNQYWNDQVYILVYTDYEDFVTVL